ncbi:complex III assembly factor LYRM7-like [Artemia franciscana]|uniref:complex III assembly factor LYRM7-like n=1 Tax=Artemia franciscana TaxID=6661 RepID=UPI0032DAC732
MDDSFEHFCHIQYDNFLLETNHDHRNALLLAVSFGVSFSENIISQGHCPLILQYKLKKWFLMWKTGYKSLSNPEVIHVFSCYKMLFRTTKIVFNGDIAALDASRQKIREEFNKNRFLSDEKAIRDLLKVGRDADEFLRRCIVQAEEVKENHYVARIRDETILQDNFLFNPDAPIPAKKPRKKCSET